MLILDGNTLTLNDVGRVLYAGEKVRAADESWQLVRQSREAVERFVALDEVVYGITTGFGKLSDVFIGKENAGTLQRNLIRSHACGVGEPFPEIVSRCMVLLRANALLKGFSGVRPELIDMLLTLVNKRIHPVIPQQGSLGASGDLAPLSHLALVVTGEGYVFYKGDKIETHKAFAKEGLRPLALQAKEGLALINGTQAMTAMGVVAYLEGECLAYQSEAVAAITVESLRGIIDAFDAHIHQARGYPEQMQVAERMRSYLQSSGLVTRQGERRVQDAYSIRCIPQVHGATWRTLNFVQDTLQIEMNAATDNPLIFEEGQKVLSGGNFHGQPVALAMDYMGIAMAELANISERRIERMVNPQLSGLPPFLSCKPGLESGAMVLQYTAASLVSENKTLAHPASVDSIPSSANQEDHVSMGTIGARHAYQIIANVRNVIAIEAICALQAVEFQRTEQMAPFTKQLYTAGRKRVAPLADDRPLGNDIERMNEWLREGDFNGSFFKKVVKTCLNRH